MTGDIARWDDRGMAGPVEAAVRRAIAPREQLHTPSGRGQFSIATHTADGLVLLLGRTQTPVRLPWRALEHMPDLLRGRGWVLIGGTYSTSGTPRSLDEHLKAFTPTATAGWIAVVLERAKIINIDRKRPAHVRLNLSGPTDAE
jgi:hypothetical protein